MSYILDFFALKKVRLILGRTLHRSICVAGLIECFNTYLRLVGRGIFVGRR